jgi:hypothetical protein
VVVCFVDMGVIVDHHCVEVVVCFVDMGVIVDHHCLEVVVGFVADIHHISLSANWMGASGYTGEDAKLFEAVQAVGMDLCPELGLTIPVGKDSMSIIDLCQTRSTHTVFTQS